MSKSIKEAFSAKFGKSETDAIIAAAEQHGKEVSAPNKGSDPFKWALGICISFECMEVESYRGYHNITTPWKELKAWIIDNANLAHFDGDLDPMGKAAGVYKDFGIGEPGTVGDALLGLSDTLKAFSNKYVGVE